MTRQVAGFADRMDVDAVGDFARHRQHPGVDGRDVDLRIRDSVGQRTGAPLPVQERELVEVTVVVEWSAAEPGETRLDGADVVAEPGSRMFEVDAVSANDVCAHLRTQPESEPAAGQLLEFPGVLGGDHRAAGEGDGDARRQVEARCAECRGGRRGECRAAALGQQHAVEPCVPSRVRRGSHRSEWLGKGHHVDAHRPIVTPGAWHQV